MFWSVNTGTHFKILALLLRYVTEIFNVTC